MVPSQGWSLGRLPDTLMPRNELELQELRVRVMKLKKELYDGTYQGASGDWHDGSQYMLNKVLDILQEYRY